MPLVVNTNVSSLNAQRSLTSSSRALSKSLERLSSGLRINHAGDDAAGMAISEGLQSQITGLNQAVRNANDGVSLIQTAEGALDTYTQILQRMRELAVQASSDVNSASNRASIQLEIDQQTQELNRIATTIDFNGSNLFDGTFTNKKIQVGAEKGQTIDISTGDLRTSIIGAVATITGSAVNQTAMNAGDVIINGFSIGDSGGSNTAIAKVAAIQAAFPQTHVSASVQAAVATGIAVAGGTLDAANSITINGATFGTATNPLVVSAGDADGHLVTTINAQSNVTGVVASVVGGNLILTAADGRNIVVTAAGAGAARSGAVAATTGGKVQLTSESAFSIAGATAAALTGVTVGTYAVDYTTAINTISVTTFDSAQNTIVTVDNALDQINNIRARLGAVTNRLENTVSNLQIVSENLSASDSTIRDADFAAETANMTRANILQQSGVAVLAQANLSPQAAIQLLQKATA